MAVIEHSEARQSGVSIKRAFLDCFATLATTDLLFA
jgi:hypothetical protein